MARLPRMVLPGIPHQVTQRGNRRERTFFEEGDYALYLDLLADAAERHGVEVWSYCLMPPCPHRRRDEDALARTFRHVHRHYTGYVNARLRMTGHLWQGRFSSVAMDEQHLHAALRYVGIRITVNYGENYGASLLNTLNYTPHFPTSPHPAKLYAPCSPHQRFRRSLKFALPAPSLHFRFFVQDPVQCVHPKCKLAPAAAREDRAPPRP